MMETEEEEKEKKIEGNTRWASCGSPVATTASVYAMRKR
jgi:hypothetical protein